MSPEQITLSFYIHNKLPLALYLDKATERIRGQAACAREFDHNLSVTQEEDEDVSHSVANASQ